MTDDFYRIEASPTGVFRAPTGHAYSTTNWNFYTPIVGGGGPNAPASNADYPTEKLLAIPNVVAPREVSATLTKNPVLAPGAGEYDWPPLSFDDLATTAVRVVVLMEGVGHYLHLERPGEFKALLRQTLDGLAAARDTTHD